MRICILTANLGGFDKMIDPVTQIVPAGFSYDFCRFTDQNFPPRRNSMTPRLQARIPKMFGWEMNPGFDYYLWVDSSCTLPRADSLAWFLEQCGEADIAVFKHPNRSSIQAEADYLKKRLEIKCPYITPRYENELIDEQMKVIKDDRRYTDDWLIASTAFIYRNNERVRKMFSNWWFHTSRYHSIDQLSLPYVLRKSECYVTVIPDSYLKTPYLKYVRK